MDITEIITKYLNEGITENADLADNCKKVNSVYQTSWSKPLEAVLKITGDTVAKNSKTYMYAKACDAKEAERLVKLSKELRDAIFALQEFFDDAFSPLDY